MAKTIKSKGPDLGALTAKVSSVRTAETRDRCVLPVPDEEYYEEVGSCLVQCMEQGGYPCIVVTIPMVQTGETSGNGNSWKFGSTGGNKRINVNGVPLSLGVNLHQPRIPAP